jgi:hypothetical protein
MNLQNRTIYLTHDEDAYEIVINDLGKILEIWRYNGNCTSKPHFCRFEWLDEILQDRVLDKLAREP